ncbi:HD family phosphohydrolase [Paenactinomyces guangxiensis]|uniref:HD family phosphohydrolase n=1 Tax=Paenactinomyces guangxiensis TaxID=1490290 RepID=A0A7W2A7H9_9BACL|nr:HD family phosphohydrolase [Paenactinomyces guangxiensis]MBA4493157.1 HD family phosphohydrolase [Paenactinomyces guangxiensis]MBH8589993.1 HD family phosphohydrolase [Paenactinomyces guangxiensis]
MKEKIEPPSNWIRKRLLSNKWDSSVRIQLLLYAIFGVAFYLLLMNHVFPEQYNIQIGKQSPATIVSPITKVDEYATEEAKTQAAKAVERQYTKDDTLTNEQINHIDHFFAEVRKIITNPSDTNEEKITKIKGTLEKKPSNDFSPEFYQNLVSRSPDQLTEIRLKTREIVYDILQEGVRKEELEEKRKSVDRDLVTSLLDSDALDGPSRSVVRELAKQSIIPNEVYDEKKTEQLRDAARDAVKAIPINKGQIIVSKDEVVTKDQYRKLEQLGLLRKKTNIFPYLGLAILILLLLAMLFYYVRRFHFNLFKNNVNLILLFSVLLLTLLGMKFIALGQNLEWNTIGYLAPVGLGTMLITLLLNIELALGCVILLAISASVFYNGDSHNLFNFHYGMVALVSGAASAFALAGVRKRSSILKAGAISSAASIIPIVSLYFLAPAEGTWKDLLQSVSFGILSGIFSAVLTIGFLPYFETLFGILSPLRLLELSNPNHPLLRKLLIETPGTYHHSVIVANLAEAAAEAIGADGLLARVGAYYHDLGKTKRPQFFIENQLYRENPHDKISPNLSKTIIISHPRDGVELLRQYRIPEPIQDIAAQHHGTTLLKYFYYKALSQQKDGAQVLEEDYRYPGPKAQFKEAAIVGIADCVEAAVRSLSRPTPSRIENMVRKIIRDRLEDGQFNECDLTFKELDLIAKSMCETLKGIFHSRIEYPEEPAIKGVKH